MQHASASRASETRLPFVHLALAGLAAGLLSNAAFASDNASAPQEDGAGMSAPASDSAAPAMPAKHGCKGQNECKGMGGCKMSKKDLKAAAKKMGIPMAKAGKAHDCKGRNECKGLGGCKAN